ncbi:MAG: SLC13 family permease [Caldilineaceae bacterium]
MTLLILCIAYSASIGAMATVMGSGENAIASSSLDQTIATGFGFLDWMKYGLPLIIILLPLIWFLLLRTISLPPITIDTSPVKQELERTGALSGPEREILLVLGVSVIFWVAGTSIETWLGLPNTILSNAVVAIGAVAVLSVEEIVDWNDLKGVTWGVFFVSGAGLTLGSALETTGASAWFATLLAPVLQPLPYIVILIALVLLGFTLTQFMNNVTLGAILTPVLVTLGEASNIAPERLLLPTIFSLALAYMLPSASARMTLVAVTGAVEGKDMLRAGLTVGIPSALIILLYFFALSWLGWI